MVSRLTASMGLDFDGKIKADDKVLIASAAGGTGHIAVQWAKVAFLKSIGADHVINYK